MPKSLAEYADWLDGRNLLWPEVPPAAPVKATPLTKPLPGIRAVTFEVYGTLLRITGGRLDLEGRDPLAFQIALEKTIEEFNVWNFLYRKPGAPWLQVREQYRKLLDERRLTASVRKGDVPEIDSAADLWRSLIAQWDRKGFTCDENLYGDRDALSEKIACFFHSRLQGIECPPHGPQTIAALDDAGIRLALLSDAQAFTVVQLDRAYRARPGRDVESSFDLERSALSFQEGVRKPSPSLYVRCLERLADAGYEPAEVLHVGSRLRNDVAIAKRLGMKTALFAGDAASFEATKEDVRDPRLAPDRLLTDLEQLRDIVGIE